LGRDAREDKGLGIIKARIVIGIPTVGRAPILCETLRELALQSHQPDSIIVCGTKEADLDGVMAIAPTIVQIFSQAGLPRQRNAIIDAAVGADLIIFFDDDFLPHADYIAEIAACMVAQPKLVVATGLVLADGIGGRGLSPVEGRAVLARAGQPNRTVTDTFSGYGCNMAVNMAPVREHHVRFDERLPLYGWQEDVDFSCRLAAYGSVAYVSAARGVHLGVKSGRNSGIRLGYSQVANPLYISRKRLGYPFRRALIHIAKNMAMNVVRSAWPEPYVDRRGRLRGNLLAFRDLVTGQMLPERILEL
jgi:GT2 family glycosyltransferase